MTMQYRNLGSSGLQVSAVGLGCMSFSASRGERESIAIVHQALDLGINLFDTADVYGGRGGSETWLGRALAGRRDKAIIATKFGGSMATGREELAGASRRYILAAVEASLTRLGTDFIDLYQLHKPDPETPLDETLRALDDLVRQGKVRHIGYSKLPPWQMVDAHWIARTGNLSPFVSTQNHYSLLTRGIETELVPAAQRCGVSVLPYFPLERGLLTDKFRADGVLPEGSRVARWALDAPDLQQKMALVTRLKQICELHGIGLLQLSMAWLLHRPWIGSVIAGASSPAQVQQNVAVGCGSVSMEALAEADAITAPAVPARARRVAPA